AGVAVGTARRGRRRHGRAGLCIWRQPRLRRQQTVEGSARVPLLALDVLVDQLRLWFCFHTDPNEYLSERQSSGRGCVGRAVRPDSTRDCKRSSRSGAGGRGRRARHPRSGQGRHEDRTDQRGIQRPGRSHRTDGRHARLLRTGDAADPQDGYMTIDNGSLEGGRSMRLIAVAVAALVLLSSGSSLAQDWIEYASRADLFTVNFPGQPNVREITYPTEYDITLPGRVYSVDAGLNRYSVTVVDYANAGKIHTARAEACRKAGGEGDACGNRWRAELQGAIVYATSNLLKRDVKLTLY